MDVDSIEEIISCLHRANNLKLQALFNTCDRMLEHFISLS